MKVYFKGNMLCTKLKVTSTISPWSKEYESTVDTGAFNTAISTDEIVSSDDNSGPTLLYRGPHHATGVGFDGLLDMYEATITVGEEDEYKDTLVIAVPYNYILLGREIISQYKWEIDWKSEKVTTTRYT